MENSHISSTPIFDGVQAQESHALNTPQRLRQMAQWYRDFADRGPSSYEKMRRDHAEHLERLAAEREAADHENRSTPAANDGRVEGPTNGTLQGTLQN